MFDVGCWALSLLALPLFLTGCSTSPPANSESASRIAYYQARTNGPASYPAYARLGLAQFEQHRETGNEALYHDALTNLLRSLAFQRNYEALLGMATALAEKHQFMAALPYAREATESMPGSPEASGVLFDIHLALGDTASAEKTSRSMIDESPGFAAFTRAAALAEYHGGYPEAIAWMKRAVSDATTRSLPAQTRAWCHVRIGALNMFVHQPLEARSAYEQALAILPGYFFAKEHLGEWYAAHGDWRAAERVYRGLLKTDPEPGYRVALAEAVGARGESREAQRLSAAALAELRRQVKEGSTDSFRQLALLLVCENGPASEAVEMAERDWAQRKDCYATDTMALALSAAGRHQEALEFARSTAAFTNNPVLLVHRALIHLRAGQIEQGAMILNEARAFELAFTVAERKTFALAMRIARTGQVAQQ